MASGRSRHPNKWPQILALAGSGRERGCGYPRAASAQCQSRATFPKATDRPVWRAPDHCDKLRCYFKPIREFTPNADHRAHKGLNNCIEGSHKPTRRREKVMGRFKSPDRHRGFSPLTIRQTRSSAPEVIGSPHSLTAPLRPTLSTSGIPMQRKWPIENPGALLSIARQRVAMPSDLLACHIPDATCCVITCLTIDCRHVSGQCPREPNIRRIECPIRHRPPITRASC